MRFDTQPPTHLNDLTEWRAKYQTPIRLRVYNVLKGWLETHWRNSTDMIALPLISTFAQSTLLEAIPTAGKRLSELCQRLMDGQTQLVPRGPIGFNKSSLQHPSAIPRSETPAPPALISKHLSDTFRRGHEPNLLDLDPLELARQLTICESRIYCSIMPEELVGQAFSRCRDSGASNVKLMSSMSNDIAGWVADSILREIDAKRRAAVVKFWIKTSERCHSLKNYDTLMAILCALNSSTITRLKQTWNALSSKSKVTLDSLRTATDHHRNYAVYRASLRSHVPPCLPFVGLYLTDLTFVDEGNPPMRAVPGEAGNLLVNYDKHIKAARIITDLQRFQIPYRLQEVPGIQQYFHNQLEKVRREKGNDVSELYRRSLLVEPKADQLSSSLSNNNSSSASLSRDVVSPTSRSGGASTPSSTAPLSVVTKLTSVPETESAQPSPRFLDNMWLAFRRA